MDTGAGMDMGLAENVAKLLPWNAPEICRAGHAKNLAKPSAAEKSKST